MRGAEGRDGGDEWLGGGVDEWGNNLGIFLRERQGGRVVRLHDVTQQRVHTRIRFLQSF